MASIRASKKTSHTSRCVIALLVSIAMAAALTSAGLPGECVGAHAAPAVSRHASAVKHRVLASSPNPTPAQNLARVQDQFHRSFDVYTDADAAGNHFSVKGRMSSLGDGQTVPTMDEACRVAPHSGANCIKAAFTNTGANWGGWYFMNGSLTGTETQPSENWGSVPHAGLDLRGAKTLSFWARGAAGGERVEFFALGVGRDPATGARTAPYPDSAAKVSSGYVTLTTTWKKHSISLRGRNISYVLGGFGWVTSASHNGKRNIAFYLDDISYDKPGLADPRFLVSYRTARSTLDFDTVLRNTAFTYDNSVALMAFLASKATSRAKLIADTLVYAQAHDRFYTDGRLRNAYQGGDLALPPGWTPNGRAGTVRMPGWYDPGTGRWLEDELQVSTSSGNMAWAMLALLSYYQKAGGRKYLTAAERMGEWVARSCEDTRGAGGYTGGFEGWEPAPNKLTYKATEHNIDLYAAFQRLYLITKDRKWLTRAEHARSFVLAMWDPAGGKFWTGTTPDGVSINKTVIPVDIQAWSLLALGAGGKPYRRSLAYAESNLAVGRGFDFNQDRDGVWYEGTAQMAAAYHQTGQQAKWKAVRAYLQAAKDPSGAMFAANKDGLTTGFLLTDGNPWLYYRRLHVGATAWKVLADYGIDPFWYPQAPP